MNNFCTLFDVNYIHRGLALHGSLVKHCPQFHLWILCMDEEVFFILEKLNLDSVTLIKLKDFEDEDLLSVKEGRSRAEYCWTCTSSLLAYVFREFHLDMCTYLDSDIYFYSDPGILLNELGDDSSLITEHRYTKKYDQTETSGKYCVQFMPFRNNKQGMFILEWWRQRCIEWCFARFEEEKFGDQKYLDDWTERFDGVHELQNIGGGVAPWNVQRYKISKDETNIYVSEKEDKQKLVFYHFHALKFIENNKVFLGMYELSSSLVRFIYANYIRELLHIQKDLLEKGFNTMLWSPALPSNSKRSLLGFLRKKRNVFFAKDIIQR